MNCDSCNGPVEDDGTSLTECAAGRYATEGACDDCGGCICDGAC